MTHPNTPHNQPASISVELTDLPHELRELSPDDSRCIRGGLLPANALFLEWYGKSQKITDGTSNTITFNEG